MPFTEAQIRAIAADRNRRHGDAGPYLHKLKAKTLKRHEQWGRTNVHKASRYSGDGAVGYRQDEFAKAGGVAATGGGAYLVGRKRGGQVEKSRRGNHTPEADRQRRLGAYMALSGTGGAVGTVGAVRGASKESKQARELARAAGQTKEQVRYLTAAKGRTKLLAALGAGGLYGARRIHRYANNTENEPWR